MRLDRDQPKRVTGPVRESGPREVRGQTGGQDMYAMRGPRQVDGVNRWFGFRLELDRNEAIRIMRLDPAALDALGPEAIIDIDGNRYYPARGSLADCRELFLVVQHERI